MCFHCCSNDFVYIQVLYIWYYLRFHCECKVFSWTWPKWQTYVQKVCTENGSMDAIETYLLVIAAYSMEERFFGTSNRFTAWVSAEAFETRLPWDAVSAIGAAARGVFCVFHGASYLHMAWKVSTSLIAENVKWNVLWETEENTSRGVFSWLFTWFCLHSNIVYLVTLWRNWTIKTETP